VNILFQLKALVFYRLQGGGDPEIADPRFQRLRATAFYPSCGNSDLAFLGEAV
jgi:hypothetical protein